METPEKLAQITPTATEKVILNAAGGGGKKGSNCEPMRRVKRSIVNRFEVDFKSFLLRFVLNG